MQLSKLPAMDSRSRAHLERVSDACEKLRDLVGVVEDFMHQRTPLVEYDGQRISVHDAYTAAQAATWKAKERLWAVEEDITYSREYPDMVSRQEVERVQKEVVERERMVEECKRMEEECKVAVQQWETEFYHQWLMHASADTVVAEARGIIATAYKHFNDVFLAAEQHFGTAAWDEKRMDGVRVFVGEILITLARYARNPYLPCYFMDKLGQEHTTGYVNFEMVGFLMKNLIYYKWGIGTGTIYPIQFFSEEYSVELWDGLADGLSGCGERAMSGMAYWVGMCL